MHTPSEQALIEAIDIPLWLETDPVHDWRARVARDRAIGANFSDMAAPPSTRLHAWWHALERDDDGRSLGQQIVLLFRRLTMVMVFLGALSGGGLASAVLFYDGSDPINVLAVLGWLVGLPLGLLVLSVVLTLSSRRGREANIGAFVLAFLLRHNPAAVAFFSARRSNRTHERLLRWQLLCTSQWGGLAFAVTTLAVLLVKVSFSDLAFAWSTTLSIETDSLANGVRWLAWPWQGWLPTAIPSFELIEQSRYFRLHDETTGLQAEALTAWWRFVALCLGVYGIGIRLLVLVIATVGLRRTTTQLLLAQSEVRALLNRFDTPSITTEAEGNDPSAPHSDRAAPLFSGAERADLIVLWHGAGKTAVAATATSWIEAGEGSLDEDLATVHGCTVPAGGNVHIVTKAWEPPMLEFHDYLRALREVFGENVSLIVEPLGDDGAQARAADLAIWRSSLGRLEDARVYLK